MKRKLNKKVVSILAIALILVSVMSFMSFASDGTADAVKMIDCSTCEGSGVTATCEACEGANVVCADCSEATNVCADCEGSGKVEAPTRFYSSIWSLLPPIIAIALALITKEVYSSLFIGIVVGGLLYAEGNFEGTITHVFSDGFVANVADSYNMGIIIFLIVLGAMVSMMNKAGGSAAFGRWAKKHIKSRVGAQLATVLFGCMIFIDDYFNCLTVGSVMRPVTDSHKVSRAKLAYLIDATAAPVCIIAPVSSWAAAVAGFVAEEEVSGFQLFLSAIPYNFYALLTIVMMVTITIMKFDFGKMKVHEENALNGDLFTSDAKSFMESADEEANPKGKVIDLILPVVMLIVACVVGLIYSGGFFDATSGAYHNLIEAFSGADASVGLLYGSFCTLILTVAYFMIRRVITFKNCMESIPEGFKAMVPAIMILACAWTLKAMTDSLGAKEFIAGIVESTAGTFANFLPAVIFLIAVGLAFATGTSWGTFGILIPLVLSVFPYSSGSISIIAISACMAGAVCGDHCSPISDTTIMASAGSQSNHINHVSTQLPYALTVAGVSFITYIIAGFVQSVIALPIGIALMLGTLFVIKAVTKKKA
ncbi:MAG: Na+/H+ antiporter NhaC family protein [Ruminococcaceae bacterium]|nr:Na+/H+ antiporter NhaC family protein [Oscillospiraceae bacterium]